MTDQTSSLEDVASLMQERRRYEAWLAAIEARRAQTPEHVYERVRADYGTRLARVDERLVTHQGALSQELAGLESRLGLLDAEEQLRRDERAEVELRGAVGELGEAEVTKALESIDESLARLTAEKTGLRADADRISEFFAVARAVRPSAEIAASPFIEARAPSEPEPAAPAPAPEPAPEAVVEPSFDEIGFLASVIGEEPAAPEAPKAPEPLPSAPEPVKIEERPAPAEAPFGANVPANTPIKLRASGAVEQSKTLKCGECGAVNYPTEWYCERCGAELAAL